MRAIVALLAWRSQFRKTNLVTLVIYHLGPTKDSPLVLVDFSI
jgi:hypothetical protein